MIPEGLLLLGAGLFWFSWLAERQKFPDLDMLWKRGRWIGAVLLILGTIAELMAYRLSLPPGIIQVTLNGRWELLLQFPFVLMLFVQLLFLILVFIPGMMRGWYLVLWLLLAATPAFGGHVWGNAQSIYSAHPTYHPPTCNRLLAGSIMLHHVTAHMAKEAGHIDFLAGFQTIFCP